MNIILLLISLVLCLFLGINSFCFITLSTLFSFFMAKLIVKKKSKTLLISTIFIHTILLLLFRILPYYNITILSTLGISYYTLQIISYLVDTYKGKYEIETNIFHYMLYITYYPHLFMGPISKYDDFLEEITKKKRLSVDNFIHGLLRISLGMVKMFIISNRINIIITTICSDTTLYRGGFALLAMLLYSINIYANFSGGIDIILGISKMFGMNLVENFDSPYYTETIQEFWRKWHISLSNWLRDYIYIPLGGSRCSRFRKCFNLLVTFLVSGIWHGFEYLVWGIGHGLLVMSGKMFKTKWKWLNYLLVYLFVSILWSFFIWPNTKVSIDMIFSIFTTFNYGVLVQSIFNLGLSSLEWIILFIFVIMLGIYDYKKDKINAFILNRDFSTKLFISLTLLFLVMVFGIYGIGFDVNNFIYSKF